jgi:hypothetical protein
LAWEKKVEEIRQIEKAEKTSNSNHAKSSSNSAPKPNVNVKAAEFSPGTKSSQQQQQQGPPEKKTLPFTNTEYTGSASLTANRNYGNQQGQAQGNRKFDDYEREGGKAGYTQHQHQHEPEHGTTKSGSDYGRTDMESRDRDRDRRSQKRKYRTDSHSKVNSYFESRQSGRM